ncbi:MAG: hypothetical protein JWL91_467 [Sphingomonas bacterium]|nr:hypothetical protein [Sphingomonas bacterium]
MTKAVFHERQYLVIAAAFGKQRFGRCEPGLFEAGCVEIEAGDRPENCSPPALSETRYDAGNEQCRGGIVGQGG